MPFDQKISSPSIYTPGAGEMTIPAYDTMFANEDFPCIFSAGKIVHTKLISSRIIPIAINGFNPRTDTIQDYVLLKNGTHLVSVTCIQPAGNQKARLLSSTDGINFNTIVFESAAGNNEVITDIFQLSDGSLRCKHFITGKAWIAKSVDGGATWTQVTISSYWYRGNSKLYLEMRYLGSANTVFTLSGIGVLTNTTGYNMPGLNTSGSYIGVINDEHYFFVRKADDTAIAKITNDTIELVIVHSGLGINANQTVTTYPFEQGAQIGNVIVCPLVGGSLVRSADGGATWTKMTPSSGYYSGGLFSVAVGDEFWMSSNGNISVSADGITWNNASTLATKCRNMKTGFAPTITYPRRWLADGKTRFIGKSNFCLYGNLPSFVELLPFRDGDAILLTANAFSPTSPAKLATLPSAVLTLDTTGAGGTVALYLQHYNDEVARWESYAGVKDEWTLIGMYSSVTNNIDLPELPARSGEKVRCKLTFASTDGTAPAPSFVSLSLSWTSDITPPDVPTKPTLHAASETSVVMNLNSLPSDARNMIVEVDSGAGYLPISSRGLVESGYGYLRFRPGNSAVQAQGEFNLQTFLLTGYSAGTTVTVRSKTEDNVGNLSDWVESDPVTTESLSPLVTPSITIDDTVLQAGESGFIKIHLNGISSQNVSLTYSFVPDTATTPEDYEYDEDIIVFIANPSSPHQEYSIPVNAVGTNNKPESTQYKVVISGVVNATLEKAEGIITIQNFDIIPYPTKTWNQTWKANRRWNVTWNQ